MAAFMGSPNLVLNHLILKDRRRIQQTAVVGHWLLVVGKTTSQDLLPFSATFAAVLWVLCG